MRGYNIDDYIGKRFNHLILIKNLNKIDDHNSKLALFKCDCGNEKEMVFTQVLNSTIKSCGCKQGYLNEQSRKKQKETLIELYKNSTMKNNKTGHTGISVANGKYRVRIQKDGKQYHLGYRDNIDEAIQLRIEGERKYFKNIDKN
ncbi:MAG: hypothetical protein HFJ40_05765 [Clostridia bacterium]|nr:hypothetical protein [Clostridia bacterium]